MRIQSSSGNVYAGEQDILLAPVKCHPENYPVVFCHGAEGSPGADAWMGLPTRWGSFNAVIDEGGATGFSSDLGGSATWGNDLVVSRMDSAFNFAQTLGQIAGKVILVAQSMGAATAIAWASANSSKVARIVLVIPVLNILDIRDNSAYANDINAAYGGLYVEATHGLNHSPLTIAQSDKLSSIPILMFYGDVDTLCKPVYAQQFAEAAGQCRAYSMSGGHAETTVAMVPENILSEFISKGVLPA